MNRDSSSSRDRANPNGSNDYGKLLRSVSLSPRSSRRSSLRTNTFSTRPSLSDDDVDSPPGSEVEGYSRESRTTSTKGSCKKVSFRDGHEEYRPTILRGSVLGRGERNTDSVRTSRNVSLCF